MSPSVAEEEIEPGDLTQGEWSSTYFQFLPNTTRESASWNTRATNDREVSLSVLGNGDSPAFEYRLADDGVWYEWLQRAEEWLRLPDRPPHQDARHYVLKIITQARAQCARNAVVPKGNADDSRGQIESLVAMQEKYYNVCKTVVPNTPGPYDLNQARMGYPICALRLVDFTKGIDEADSTDKVIERAALESSFVEKEFLDDQDYSQCYNQSATTMLMRSKRHALAATSARICTLSYNKATRSGDGMRVIAAAARFNKLYDRVKVLRAEVLDHCEQTEDALSLIRRLQALNSPSATLSVSRYPALAAAIHTIRDIQHSHVEEALQRSLDDWLDMYNRVQASHSFKSFRFVGLQDTYLGPEFVASYKRLFAWLQRSKARNLLSLARSDATSQQMSSLQARDLRQLDIEQNLVFAVKNAPLVEQTRHIQELEEHHATMRTQSSLNRFMIKRDTRAADLDTIQQLLSEPYSKGVVLVEWFTCQCAPGRGDIFVQVHRPAIATVVVLVECIRRKDVKAWVEKVHKDREPLLRDSVWMIG